jgi:DNA-binding transcriptional MerR regulator
MRRLSNERLQHISELNPTSDLGECARELLAYRAHGLSPEEVGELLAIGNQGGEKVMEAEKEIAKLQAENERLRADKEALVWIGEITNGQVLTSDEGREQEDGHADS